MADYDDMNIMRADRVEDALDKVGGGDVEAGQKERSHNMVHI